jgi:hypothetical protein
MNNGELSVKEAKEILERLQKMEKRFDEMYDILRRMWLAS